MDAHNTEGSAVVTLCREGPRVVLHQRTLVVASQMKASLWTENGKEFRREWNRLEASRDAWRAKAQRPYLNGNEALPSRMPELNKEVTARPQPQSHEANRLIKEAATADAEEIIMSLERKDAAPTAPEPQPPAPAQPQDEDDGLAAGGAAAPEEVVNDPSVHSPDVASSSGSAPEDPCVEDVARVFEECDVCGEKKHRALNREV
eukprot:g22170.t1